MRPKTNLAKTLRAAGLAATLALLASAAPAQVLPPAPDCKPGRPPCDEYLELAVALERYRVAYLGAVGACGREDACVPRIKPNLQPIDSLALSRGFSYAVDACIANDCANKYPGPDNAERRLQCVADAKVKPPPQCVGTTAVSR